MTWKVFFLAWLAGTLGVSLGRWFWAWWERRKVVEKQ